MAFVQFLLIKKILYHFMIVYGYIVSNVIHEMNRISETSLFTMNYAFVDFL